MTVQHESLHFLTIEDTTSTAAKLSLKELKPIRVSKKKVKEVVEGAVNSAPVFFGSLEQEEFFVVNGSSSLFDDPENSDVW
jgi:hypothetical protein